MDSNGCVKWCSTVPCGEWIARSGENRPPGFGGEGDGDSEEDTFCPGICESGRPLQATGAAVGEGGIWNEGRGRYPLPEATAYVRHLQELVAAAPFPVELRLQVFREANRGGCGVVAGVGTGLDSEESDHGEGLGE